MAPHQCLNYLHQAKDSKERGSCQPQQAICSPIFGTFADSELKFKELFLVPGGRFLVILQETIALWDLRDYTKGSISKFTRHIEPLAFDTPPMEKATGIELEWITVHPTTDSLGLHIHVHAEVYDGDDV